MSLCMYIKHAHLDAKLPGRLVLQSPGLQVPPSFFCNITPVHTTGDDAYLLNPILFDFTGFPSIDIFYGTREVMIAFLKDFQETCRRYDVTLKTHIGKGMMHCWGPWSLYLRRRQYAGVIRGIEIMRKEISGDSRGRLSDPKISNMGIRRICIQDRIHGWTMDNHIENNKLKTDGIYACVRNPMYSGWWMAITGHGCLSYL